MKTRMQMQKKTASTLPPSFTPVHSMLLQRKCACGGTPGMEGECASCRQKRLLLQRSALKQDHSSAEFNLAPAFGQLSTTTTPASKESHLGHDFSHIPVHAFGHESRPLLAPFAMSQPGDFHEQEADRVAGQIMQLPASSTQVQQTYTSNAGPGGENKARMQEQRNLQRSTPSYSATPTMPSIIMGVLNSPGQPLDPETRVFMEPHFGHDFSGVRVHNDAQGATSAQAVNARAYTVGNHIVFDAGQYAPGTSRGRQLLAHELTHTLQQTAAGTAHAGRANLLQRTIGDGHDLTNEHFAGDPDLEAAYDNEQLLGNAHQGLSFKSHGPGIKKIQDALITLGFSLPDFGPDGIFGDETEAAVKAFQRSKGLTGRDADGIVGPITMGLFDKFAPAPSPAPVPPSPTQTCSDVDTVNQEKDPLPAFTPFNPVEIPASTLRQKAIELSTAGQSIPKNPLAFTVPDNKFVVPPASFKALPTSNSSCMKCVAEWDLSRPSIITLIGSGLFTLDEPKRHWVNQQNNKTGCPSFGTFGDEKEVGELIEDSAQPLLRSGELEHYRDLQYAFDVIGGRYLANIRRLTPERTHLRGKDQSDCEIKIKAFLDSMIRFQLRVGPKTIMEIPVISGGVPYHQVFIDSYEEVAKQSDQRDKSGQHAFTPEPPGDRAPFPPDEVNNPFGCSAFWRRLTSRAGFKAGPPSKDLIKLTPFNSPPKQAWHEF